MNKSMRFSAVAVLLVLTTLSVGCSQSGPVADTPTAKTTTAPGVEDILQYSNRWIENPVIDLMSPEGTFVRAAMESLDRVGYGKGSGINAIEDAGYLGFQHAFNDVRDPDQFGRPAGKDTSVAGTKYWEVVKFSRDGDLFTAGVCGYGSMTTEKVLGGYRSSGRGLPAGSGTWITFGPDRSLPPDQQVLPPSHQEGPRRTPADNVFGSWVLTDMNVLDAAVDLAQCAKTLAPGTPEDAPDRYVVLPNPLPTLPPSPGWPES